MAQPLVKSDADSEDEPFVSSLDSAVTRLELAFTRLEGAVANARAGHHSIKADHEKLNHLLQEADSEIERLREVTHMVSARLDQTITTLEAWDA